MALKIRLARGGRKARPFYSIVIADSRAPRDGRFIEKVGTYNPMLPSNDEKRVVLKEDRIKHWIGNGAKPSERVALFLAKAGLGEAPAITEKPNKSAPKAKAQERIREKEEKAAAAAEAAKQAEEEAKAAAEAPAEEPAAEEAPAEEAPAAEEENKAE